MRTLRAMRNLGVSGLLLASLLCTGPVMAADKGDIKAPPTDPIVKMESDVIYDAGYLMGVFGTFVEELKVEFADDPEAVAGIEETYGFVQALGLDYITTIRQQISMDDAAFNEICTISMDPAGSQTPMGKWLNLEGTRSTFGGDLGDEEFLVTMTLARPGDYLALCAESEKTHDKLMDKMGTPPAAVVGAMGIVHEYGPAVHAMLADSDAIHIVLWGVDIAAMDIQAAIVVEYDDTAQPFTSFMNGYTEKRKLTWNQKIDDKQVYQTLTDNKHIPIPLTYAVSDRIAVMATSQPTAAASLTSAMASGNKKPKEYIYLTRVNIERLRQLVPPWAADLAMAQAGAQGSAIPDLSEIMEMPMGEITVHRAATPNALTVSTTVDRELVRVFAKVYEVAMKAGIKDMLKSEQKTRRQQKVQESADALREALDAHYVDQGAYPASATDLLNLVEKKQINPFTKEPVQAVTFEERSQGNFTYVPIKTGGTVVGYQLLVYGATADYEDKVDNYVQNEDGSFIETDDGYEDMIQVLYSSAANNMDEEGVDDWDLESMSEESADMPDSEEGDSWDVGQPEDWETGSE